MNIVPALTGSEGLVLSDVHVGCPASELVWTSLFRMENIEEPRCVSKQQESISMEPRDRKPGAATSAWDSADSEDETKQGTGSDTEVGVDEGGDLILRRPRKRLRRGAIASPHPSSLLIHHAMGTNVEDVGLQVWRGALLLADFLLQDHERWRGGTVLELGGGTGLVGIVASRAAARVFITDRGNDILSNCLRNVEANCHDASYSTLPRVRHLDWEEGWPRGSDGGEVAPYDWTREELVEVYEADVLLAADVVYSCEITEAFFRMVSLLMPKGSSKVLYLALEKRYNFSMDEVAVVATGYEHFKSFFVEHSWKSRIPSGNEDADGLETKCDCREDRDTRQWVSRRQPCHDIKQSILDYERGNDLELWEIKRR